MARLTAVASLSLACLANLPANADQLRTTSALDAFYGMCLAPDFSAKRLADFADWIEWEQIPEPVLNMMRPQSSFETWHGWTARAQEGNPYPFFAFGGKSLDGTEVCGAFFADTNPATFRNMFQKETKAKKVEQTEELGNTVTIYSIPDLPNAKIRIEAPRGAFDVRAFAIHQNE